MKSVPASLADASVAWIGLGKMGEVMAERILDAGVGLTIYNRTATKVEPFVARGAARLDSVAAAADHQVVFSMISDDAALDALHDPATGMFSRQDSSIAVWIDGSTVSSYAAARAAASARAAGACYVSAPVSGNPTVIRSGNAVFAISGDARALDIADELLSKIGRAVHRVGSAAEANVIKLCVNAVLGITMQALAEVAVLADKSGVSRAALMAFLNDSAIGSPFSRYKSTALVALDFHTTFTPEQQRKDVRLALGLAAQKEVPMPVLSTTEVALSRLISGGLGTDRDFAALILEVAQDAGHELIPETPR